MGDAIKNAGLLFGSLGTILLGLVCLYNDHILVCNNLVFHMLKSSNSYSINTFYLTFQVQSSVKIRDKLKLPNEPNLPETIELCFEHGPIVFRKWKTFVK